VLWMLLADIMNILLSAPLGLPLIITNFISKVYDLKLKKL